VSTTRPLDPGEQPSTIGAYCWLTLLDGLDARIELSANTGAGIFVTAEWGPLADRRTLSARCPGHAEAKLIAHRWREDIIAGRQPGDARAPLGPRDHQLR
jgi:hypothetical protein